MIYAAEKAVKDNGEKIGPELVKEVSDAIEAAKTAAKSEDPATIKGATDALSQTMSKIGEAMMKNQPPPTGPDSAGGTPPPGPETPPPTDADFTEKP